MLMNGKSCLTPLVKNRSRVLDDDSVIHVGSVAIYVRKASFDAFSSSLHWAP